MSRYTGRKYKQTFVNIYAGTKKRKHQERLNVYKSSRNFAEFASKTGARGSLGKVFHSNHNHCVQPCQIACAGPPLLPQA